MHTLRVRLILSHILPVLLILPLLGLGLIYVLETHVFLPALTDEMSRQAELVAALAGADPTLWQTPAEAAAFVRLARVGSIDSILLVKEEGELLASSEPQGLDVDLPEFQAVLAGESREEVRFSDSRQVTVAKVWVPVYDSQGQIIGALRLTHELHTFSQNLLSLRYWILGLLLLALSVGATIGTLLALNLEQPIGRVTQAVYELASGARPVPLPEQGPEEIRVLLAAVNSLTERLRTLESGRRRLLANLVHELGRPLGAMHAAVQALRSGAADDPAFRDELLAGIEGEVQRLGRLLENLAQVHDRVLGTFELEREILETSTWLSIALTPWRAAAETKGLVWRVELPSNLPPLFADPDRLGQVLGNLLANAIKYTLAGGTIWVSAAADDTLLWVRVEDSGPGIALNEQERIFDPFYRSSAQTRFPQGMGLGLTIARDIALAHGGYLTVESVSGQGSVFTLYLPHEGDERGRRVPYLISS